MEHITKNVTDQTLLRSTLLAHLLDENLSPSSSVNFHSFSLHRGSIVTDSLVHQVCEFNPGIKFINLEYCCSDLTDLGVLAIARHCHYLEEIKLSDCSRLTQVGVRALALNCPLLKSLYFKRCTKVDDGSLRIIAANVRCLEQLVLEGCSQVSDCGISEVAQWCRNLTLINLRCCIRIGELGDKSLKMLGNKSQALDHIDLTDCANVSDKAIKSLSYGCRHLTHLKLSGCTLLTGKSFREYLSAFSNLTVLTLANCCKVEDKDLAFLTTKCRYLKSINVSCSPAMSLMSLEAILDNCQTLEDLDISGNKSVDDSFLDSIAKGKTMLCKLTMQNCPLITEKGIENLVIKTFNLLHIDLSGCLNIQNLFIYRIASHMPFSDVSRSFLGFQPKSNSVELIKRHDNLMCKNESLLLLQRVMRGFLVRVGEVSKMRLTRKIAVVIPIIQALARGFSERLAFREAHHLAMINRNAVLIQKEWRRHIARQELVREIKSCNALKRWTASSASMQRVYRGYCYGRKSARETKEDTHRQKLEDANKKASKIITSLPIQKSMKCAIARDKRMHLKRVKKFEIERQQFICSCTTVIQKYQRCRRDRLITNMQREKYKNQKLRVLKATTIQVAWRHAIYYRVRRQKTQSRIAASVIRLQAWWLKKRSDIIFSKFQTQRIEGHNQKKFAIAMLQRMERGRAARLLVQRKELSKRRECRVTLASRQIQGAVRCYLCREKSEVQKDVNRIECKMKLLFPKFEVTTCELHEINSKIIVAMADASSFEKEISELQRELRFIDESGAKYWDSDRITGTPQRFLTSVIYTRMKVILNETYVGSEATLKAISAMTAHRDELIHTTVFLKSEISYLNTVALERAKIERSNQSRGKLQDKRRSVL